MTNEDLDHIAEALKLLYNMNERKRIVDRLNQDLPKGLRLASTGVAISEDDFLDALEAAQAQLSRIMLSSGFNPWLLTKEPDLDDPDYEIKKKYYDISKVSTFNEFQVLASKISKLETEYHKLLMDVKILKGDE